MRYRAKESSPIYNKLNELFKKADELGISIVVTDFTTLVTDNETGKQYCLEDLEDLSRVQDIPPALEWKLIIDESVINTHPDLLTKQ